MVDGTQAVTWSAESRTTAVTNMNAKNFTEAAAAGSFCRGGRFEKEEGHRGAAESSERYLLSGLESVSDMSLLTQVW